MHTSGNLAFTRPRRRQFLTEARIGVRAPPPASRESYLWLFALVGVLGGVAAALVWLKMMPGF
jgi:hypothetical protein